MRSTSCLPVCIPSFFVEQRRSRVPPSHRNQVHKLTTYIATLRLSQMTLVSTSNLLDHHPSNLHHCQHHHHQPQLQGGDQDDIINWFEGVAEAATLAQAETLLRILHINRGTEYLRRWIPDDIQLDQLTPRELADLFASLVPLSSHADVEPYVRRIADGDSGPLITQQPIPTLSLSSGTTDGRPKYVPFTRYSAQTTLQIFRVAAAYRSRVVPIKAGGRILEFIYSSKQFKTKGGLTVGTATTHYFESEEFKIKQRTTKSFTCSPREVISGGDYKESTYCHLLLGLHYSDEVEFVTSTFAYSVVQAFRSLEELWRELVADLGAGEVSAARVTSAEMRRVVEEVMREGNVGLAEKLERKFVELEGRGWEGMVPELWPNAKYVYAIMTGSMLPYMRKLRHYAGGLPLVAAEYGSTESWIGVNLEPCRPPEEAMFAVVPTFSYFEFIPLYRHAEGEEAEEEDFVEAEPVPLSRVKVGQEYELVLTTFTGLYRYRLGDVVEVGGFHGKTPLLKFVCRRKLILTINIDKNTERDLQLVVETGSRLLARTGSELVDFTSHAETTADPTGHYVIYWEIQGTDRYQPPVQEDALQLCCREMDLAFLDRGYVVSRKTGSIGPLELRVVENGTFGKILDHYIGNGSAMSQFKTPRCTNNPILLDILDRCTVQSIHSTAYD